MKAKSTGKVKVLAVFLGLSLTSAKTQGQASLQSIFIRSDPIKCFTVLSRKRERGRKREGERERADKGQVCVNFSLSSVFC